ncbi:NUDIX domain-containing protein [Rhizocola hellebori]|uniref:NUDIX domain-containing protein n=1 Tax=Rhizocola hellebori TaxID=1392758 RepID=UPI001942BE9D|nr:NUDIX hydrolase [Rhizocola hellebori]
MTQRRRAAAVIIRDGKVLMVRERSRGDTGRHDGQSYWTLPGGGLQPGETDEQAVRREVAEEVGLTAISATYIRDMHYPSGITAVFAVTVADGEPRLGADDLPCDCPRMIGLDWIPLPTMAAVPAMLIEWPELGWSS